MQLGRENRAEENRESDLSCGPIAVTCDRGLLREPSRTAGYGDATPAAAGLRPSPPATANEIFSNCSC